MAFISYACGEGGAKETHTPKLATRSAWQHSIVMPFGVRLVKEGDSIQTFYEA